MFKGNRGKGLGNQSKPKKRIEVTMDKTSIESLMEELVHEHKKIIFGETDYTKMTGLEMFE